MQFSDVTSLPLMSMVLMIAGDPSTMSQRRSTVGTESGPERVRSTTGSTRAYRYPSLAYALFTCLVASSQTDWLKTVASFFARVIRLFAEPRRLKEERPNG